MRPTFLKLSSFHLPFPFPFFPFLSSFPSFFLFPFPFPLHSILFFLPLSLPPPFHFPFPFLSSFFFPSSTCLSVSTSVRPIFEALYLHNGARYTHGHYGPPIGSRPPGVEYTFVACVATIAFAALLAYACTIFYCQFCLIFKCFRINCLNVSVRVFSSYTVSQKTCQFYSLNNFTKHWPILIIFCKQNQNDIRRKCL